MSDCLFCRIASGEIPAKVVHQDDKIVVFRDVNPQAPTHLLVIPKRHVASLAAARPEDEGLLGRLMMAARAAALAEGLDARGFRVVANSGAEAGQSVFHIHLHVLGGRPMGWPPG